MVGNEENSSGAWMNSDVIRIRIDSVIEIARNRSSTIAGKGRISTTRMVRMPNASAISPRLKMLPISPKLGKPPPAPRALTRRDIDHGCRFPPRVPPASPKRLRGGRWATVSKVRHRTGVHGDSSRIYAIDDTRLHSAILAGCMVSKGLTGGLWHRHSGTMRGIRPEILAIRRHAIARLTLFVPVPRFPMIGPGFYELALGESSFSPRCGRRSKACCSDRESVTEFLPRAMFAWRRRRFPNSP